MSPDKAADIIAAETELRYVRESKRWYLRDGSTGEWSSLYFPAEFVSARLKKMASEPGRNAETRAALASYAMMLGVLARLKRLLASDEKPITEGRARVS